MKYKISYNEIYSFYMSEMYNSYSKTNILNDSLPSAVQAIIESDRISGATAERMRNYMKDVHLPILSLLLHAFQLIVADIAEYQHTYFNSVDSAAKVCFSSEEFQQIRNGFNPLKGKTTDIDQNIRSILSSAAKAGYSPNEVGGYPGVDDILAHFGDITAFIDNIDERVTCLENDWKSKVANDFDGLLDTLERYVNENLGHNHMYIAGYSPGNRGMNYTMVEAYNRAIDNYISANTDLLHTYTEEIRVREFERDTEEIEQELIEQNKNYALAVRIYGYVGDACLTGMEIALVAFGVPKSVVSITTGTAKSAWDSYYQTVSDEIEGYRLGDSALVDNNELLKTVAVDTGKGLFHSVVSVGVDGLSEEIIGRIPLVDSLTDSENVVTKFLSKATVKTMETRLEDISNNAVDQYIDTAVQQYKEGSAYAGVSPIQAALSSIDADLNDKGALGRAAAESLISEGFSASRKKADSAIKTPDKLLETHTTERMHKAGISSALESLSKEITGTAVEGFIEAGEGRELRDGFDAVVEQFTDAEKREALFVKTGSGYMSGVQTDFYRQIDEADRILKNEQEKVREQATQSMGRKIPVPIDKYGNPDYEKTSAIYKDKATGEKASVTIREYANDDYNSLVARAERAYGVKIEPDRLSLTSDSFVTPSGYRWVLKYDQHCDQQSVTLQLVKADKLPQ